MIPSSIRIYPTKPLSFNSLSKRTRKVRLKKKPSNIPPPTTKPIIKTDKELSEELNSTHGGYIWRIHTPNGAVNFVITEYNGCCGLSIAYNFRYGNIKDRDLFYKEVKDYFLSDLGITCNRSHLMFTDAVGGEHDQVIDGKPCVYEMCQSWRLKEQTGMFNQRTGHELVQFTMDREVIGRFKQYTKLDNGEVKYVGM